MTSSQYAHFSCLSLLRASYDRHIRLFLTFLFSSAGPVGILSPDFLCSFVSVRKAAGEPRMFANERNKIGIFVHTHEHIHKRITIRDSTTHSCVSAKEPRISTNWPYMSAQKRHMSTTPPDPIKGLYSLPACQSQISGNFWIYYLIQIYKVLCGGSDQILQNQIHRTRFCGTGVKLNLVGFFISTRSLSMIGWKCLYGVATVSRIDKIIGVFCRILSLL